MESHHHLGPHLKTLQPLNPAQGTHAGALDGEFALLENPAVEGAAPFYVMRRWRSTGASSGPSTPRTSRCARACRRSRQSRVATRAAVAPGGDTRALPPAPGRAAGSIGSGTRVPSPRNAASVARAPVPAGHWNLAALCVVARALHFPRGARVADAVRHEEWQPWRPHAPTYAKPTLPREGPPDPTAGGPAWAWPASSARRAAKAHEARCGTASGRVRRPGAVHLRRVGGYRSASSFAASRAP